MSYIGKEPQTGAYSMLDNLTASATANYSLTLDSVAFVPESANHLIVSLNGVIQKAGSSFTVSSSTLTFSSALTSSDSIDFVLALGNVLDIGTPSDSTVTNAKTNFVSTSSAAGLQIKGDNTTGGTLQLNCEQNSHGIKLRSPAHSAGQSYTLTFPTGNVTADKFLKVASVSGSGATGIGQLSFADAGGNSPSFMAELSSSQTLSTATETKIIFDSEIYDTDNAYNTSTGIFTAPSAGKYLIVFGVRRGGFTSARFFAELRCTSSSPNNLVVENASNDTVHGSAVGSIIINMSANDQAFINAFHNRGSDGTVTSDVSFFGATKLGGV